MRLIKFTTLLVAFIAMSCSSKNTNYMDTFKTLSGKEISITPIKHASMEINYNGLEFQIDPVALAQEPATDYTAFPKADCILVTHDHFDHLDAEAIATLSKEGTRIIANPASIESLGKGKALRNGDSLRLAPDINIIAVPAYNTTPGNTQFHPKGHGNGYILELDNMRIYIAGDTEVIPAMDKLGKIDIAFLPCNQPFTMLPAQMREAAKKISPRILYPYHFSSTPRAEMQKVMEGTGIEVRIRSFE